MDDFDTLQSIEALVSLRRHCFANLVLRKRSFHFLERIKAEGERILKENDPRSTSRINPHSIFWMVAALAVFYYSDFYIAVRFDSRIHR